MVTPFAHISQIASEMQEIETVYAVNDTAKYRIVKQQLIGGVLRDITYYIYFKLDDNGIWRLERM